MHSCELNEIQKPSKPFYNWQIERGAARNFRRLGARLAESGALYRNGSDGLGLLQLLSDASSRLITKGSQLAPVIVDRVNLVVTKEGKVTGDMPTAATPFKLSPPDRVRPEVER